MDAMQIALMFFALAFMLAVWAHARVMVALEHERRARLDAETRERQAIADLAACRSALDSRLAPQPFRHPVVTSGRRTGHVDGVPVARRNSAAQIGRMLKESR